MRILFLIRSLDTGGAERQMTLLANGLKERGHDVAVAVMYAGGQLEKDLDNVPLIDLAKGGRWKTVDFLQRLHRAVKSFQPDIIQGFLGTANLMGTVLKPFLPKMKTVWGIRASNMDLSRYSVVHRLHFQAEKILSRYADTIVANSHAGLAHIKECGFVNDNFAVVHNGINTDAFTINQTVGTEIRRSWGVQPDECLIGLVARMDPKKGHEVFLESASIASQKNRHLKFAIIGQGSLDREKKLRSMATDLGISDSVIWAGRRDDMNAVYNALDICCLSSLFGEGFPNVLGEAMCCGVPCITSDVGDAAFVVGPLGKVVPPNNSNELAKSLLSLASSSKETLNSKAQIRERIVSCFSQSAMLKEMEHLYIELISNHEK